MAEKPTATAPNATPENQSEAGKPPVQTPPEPKPKPTPAKTEPARMNEHLPEGLIKGLKEAGIKAEDILSTKSYPEQKMWRVVTSAGQRHEVGFDGQWLTKPKAKPEAKKA